MNGKDADRGQWRGGRRHVALTRRFVCRNFVRSSGDSDDDHHVRVPLDTCQCVCARMCREAATGLGKGWWGE